MLFYIIRNGHANRPALGCLKTICLLFVCLFPSAFIYTLPAQTVISLTVDDGLSQGYSPSISCDEDGFVWVATLNGLNRYDGHTFQVWKEQEGAPFSLSSNFILTILSDKRGLLWISTNKGMQVMNRRTGRIVSLACLENTTEKIFNNIILDHQGRIWASNEQKLFCLTLPEKWSSIEDIAREATLHIVNSHRSFQIITSVIQYGEGFLLTTDTGVYTFDPQSDQYKPFNVFPGGFARGAWVDSTGRQLLVRYVDKLYALENGELRSWPMEHPVWMHQCNILSNAGKVYLLAQHKVYVWENGKPEALPVVLEEEIVSGAVDNFGQLWLGTNAKGLRIVKRKLNVFSAWLQGVSIGGAIFDTKDQIWVPERAGNFEMLFRLIDKKTGQLSKTVTKRPYQILYFLPQGGSWAVNSSGRLEQLREDGTVVEGSSYQIRSDAIHDGRASIMKMTRAGRLLLCSRQGVLLMLDPTTQQERVLDMGHMIVGASGELYLVEEDRDGNFWLGTTVGLFRVTVMDSDVQIIQIKGPAGKALSSEKINTVFIDPAEPEVLWAGTVSGLNRVDMKTLDVLSFTQKDGLNDDFIYTILPGRNGDLWLGTNRGLLRFNRNTQQVVQYTVADGLPASEFNTAMAWQGKDSTLYFGTVEGVVFFNPFKMPLRGNNPQIRITGLEVNGHPLTLSDSSGSMEMIPYTGSLTFLPQENNLAFRFTVMDFFNYEKYNCRYMLTGADNDWRYTWSNNLITYSSLAPGDYTFMVSAGDGTGGWSETRSLSITILSPWWKRWWAYMIWLSMAAAAAWSIFTVRKRITGMRRQMELDRIEARYLAELEENKTKMFVNIAHEIRTPLTILLGLTEEVHLSAEPKWKEKTTLMYQSGQQLLNVVQQIFNLIKLEQQRLELNPHYGDLAAFIRLAVEPFKPMLNSRNITFSLNIPDQPVMMMFDAQYMQPVVSNLLSNAIKFTAKGGVITINLWQESADKVFLSVEDTGIGIAVEHLSKIFDRYYQVGGTHAETSGTGIGLTYVSELLKLMGGEISVRSEAGKGTVFTVVLPMLDGVAELPVQGAPMVLEEPEMVDTAFEKKSGKPLVLIVEDNYEMAQFIGRSLIPDFRVQYATNGKEGLEMAGSIVPDLIVSDVMMPEMNGFDFCAAIKTHNVTNHIPVLLLTARAEEIDRIQGLSKGANAYLTKPFSREVLRLHLMNLMALRNSVRVKWQHGTLTPQHLNDEAGKTQTPEQIFAKMVYEVIAGQYANADFGVDDLCRHFSMSNSQFHRKTAAVMGNTPGQLIREFRLERGRELLTDPNRLNISEIAYTIGFRDPNYFSQAFSAAYGQSPRQYRQAHETGDN